MINQIKKSHTLFWKFIATTLTIVKTAADMVKEL